MKILIFTIIWLLTSNAFAKPPSVSILFFETNTNLPISEYSKLDSILQAYKKSRNKMRFFVKAFAALPDKPSWSAVSLSLDRALVVRNYLKQHKVPQKDIIIQALGNNCAAPCQRVDIYLQQ